MSRYFLVILFLAAASVAQAQTLEAPSAVPVGRSFIAKVYGSSGVPLFCRFLGREQPVVFQGGEGVVILGVSPETAPRLAPLELVTLRPHSLFDTKSIRILPVRYPRSYARLPQRHVLRIQKRKEIAAEEWSRIEAVLQEVSPHRLWEGFFDRPVPGIITQEFGTVHVVNGAISSWHRGVDLRAKPGSPVLAANYGVVKIAENFEAFGNTVVIDHGLGVYSLYFHLSRILVQPDEKVGKAQVIGLSGNTGFSSGPHLHWGMSVANVRVDPWQWLEEEF